MSNEETWSLSNSNWKFRFIMCRSLLGGSVCWSPSLVPDWKSCPAADSSARIQWRRGRYMRWHYQTAREIYFRVPSTSYAHRKISGAENSFRKPWEEPVSTWTSFPVSKEVRNMQAHRSLYKRSLTSGCRVPVAAGVCWGSRWDWSVLSSMAPLSKQAQRSLLGS